VPRASYAPLTSQSDPSCMCTPHPGASNEHTHMQAKHEKLPRSRLCPFALDKAYRASIYLSTTTHAPMSPRSPFARASFNLFLDPIHGCHISYSLLLARLLFFISSSVLVLHSFPRYDHACIPHTHATSTEKFYSGGCKPIYSGVFRNRQC
jgi:hypothetical protein